MVGPCGGFIIAHLENIYDHAVDSGAWVAPDVEEKPKCTDVEQSFHRKLSEEEMQGWDGGSPTQLQESSEDFPLEDLQWPHVAGADWKGCETGYQGGKAACSPEMCLQD